MNGTPAGVWVGVDTERQQLTLWQGARTLERWPVSTATAGLGERRGSGATPRGWHTIRARIGAGAPRAAVFVARRPTGELWSPERARRAPQRDWILTRILWLSGQEPGLNRLGEVDTMRRLIYIHGCPDDAPLGVAGSHGCIRMGNDAVVELFDRVAIGTGVWIGTRLPERSPPGGSLARR